MNRSDLYPQTFSEWHAGELALQQMTGAAEMLAPYAPQILRASLSGQLRSFFPLLPFLVLGVVDEYSHPWATMLPGHPGFAWSPTETLLRIDRHLPAGDSLAPLLKPSASVAVLGIELATRRRNRVNGVISDLDPTGFSIKVQQAYGNCPQYIQQRALVALGDLPDRVVETSFDELNDADARQLISEADTIFVATFAPGPDGKPAVDVSHRGGRPGFIRLDENGSLTIPDFSGNKFFNTLGNILLTGQAGIVIPSFETGDLLMLSGKAIVRLDKKSYREAARFPGAERLWDIIPVQGRWLRGALPLTFQLQTWSSQTLATGVWP